MTGPSNTDIMMILRLVLNMGLANLGWFATLSPVNRIGDPNTIKLVLAFTGFARVPLGFRALQMGIPPAPTYLNAAMAFISLVGAFADGGPSVPTFKGVKWGTLEPTSKVIVVIQLASLAQMHQLISDPQK